MDGGLWHMRRYNYLTLIVLAISFGLLWSGRVPAQGIGRYDIEEFEPAHKAGVPGVYTMFQDQLGILWFGSTNGIFRYDGSTIDEFPAPDKQILGKTNYRFLEATNGDVIIGSDYGLCRYTLRTGKLSLLVHIDRVFNDASYYFPLCFDQSGRLWFAASGKGIGIYDGQVHWEKPESDLAGITLVKSTDVCYDAKKKVIHLSNYRGHQYITINTETHATTVSDQPKVNSLLMKDGVLYKISCNEVAISKLATGEESLYTVPQNISNQIVCLYARSAMVDTGYLWISLMEGILPFDIGKRRFGQPIGISNDPKCPLIRHISALFVDKNGTLWICTETNGIKRLNLKHQQRFQQLTDIQSTENIIMDVAGVNDSLILECPLVAPPRLTDIFTNRHYPLLPGNPQTHLSFQLLHQPDQSVLLHDQSGKLFVLNKEKLKLEPVKAMGYRALATENCIALGRTKYILVHKLDSLILCEPAPGQMRAIKRLSVGIVMQNLLIDPFRQLIYGSNQEKCILVRYPSLELIKEIPSFFGSFQDYAWGKDSTLWMATRSGLLHYNQNLTGTKRYNTSNGLNNDVVYSMAFNHDSSALYMGTNMGISQIDLRTFKIRNFTQSDGLHESEHNGGAACKDRLGRFYFGNIRGTTVFGATLGQTEPDAPFLIVQKILIDGHPYLPDINPNFVKQVELYPGDHTLQITYSLLQTAETERIGYSYKIEGIDAVFQYSSTPPTIRFTKPLWGDYTLVLRGKVNGSRVVERKIILSSHAPFYLRWWFVVPAVLVFHLIMISIIRNIIRDRVRKKQKEIEQERRLFEQKTRIARELHDNVGARLSMMLNTVDWISKKPDIGSGDLSEIKENTKSIIQGLRDAIWVMDKSEISGEELFDKIKYYSGLVAKNQPVRLAFDQSPQLSAIKLDTNQALNLFRIVQESLNNALKYARANEIKITMECQMPNGLKLTIVDDGIGFDPENVLRGHGLHNLQARAEEIKAQLQIKSCEGKGTCISVVIYIV